MEMGRNTELRWHKCMQCGYLSHSYIIMEVHFNTKHRKKYEKGLADFKVDRSTHHKLVIQQWN